MLLRKPKAKQGTLFKMMSEKKDCIKCLEKNAYIFNYFNDTNVCILWFYVRGMDVANFCISLCILERVY